MKKRIWELDAFRGICILGVVIVHFVFDLTELYRIVDWKVPTWFAFVQQWGGVLFLLISGISATLGSRSVRRGIIVLAAGCLITAVTYGMYAWLDFHKSIIIYFGDHMSDAGTKTEKMMAQQSWYRVDSFNSDVRSHTVPYLVWSNCGIETGQQEIMDISMLLPTVLAQTDVQMPYFWHYLLELQDVCGAFNSSVAVSADLSTRKRSDLTRAEQAYLETYELLTYDYVWGSRYAEALWELAE